MYLDTTYISTKFQPRSDFKYGRLAILEIQLRAIDLNLCTYVPLGKSNSQTKFRFSLILGLATRVPIPKTQKGYNS
jgi:hypothetical protein